MNADALAEMMPKFEDRRLGILLLASWIVELALWIALIVFKFALGLPMGGATIALWAVTLLLPVAEFVLMRKRLDDDYRRWLVHSLMSMAMLLTFSLAMALWVGDGHGSFDKAAFQDILLYSKVLMAVWAVYAFAGTGLFVFSVVSENLPAFREKMAGRRADRTAAKGSAANEAAAVTAAGASKDAPVSDFQAGLEAVLADMDRFDAADRGGN